MDQQPVVSVVLPVFNAAAYLAEAIASMLGQSLRAIELIVIDDGSTDESGRIAAEHAARDGRVRVISRENRGLTRSLNEGLAAARANYVAIMNADDVSLPDRLARQAAFLDRHPRVAAVGGQVRLMMADGSLGPATRLPLSPAAVRTTLATISPFAHPAVMLRREQALAAGGYRPQIEPAEDLDLWLRLAERHDLANLPDEVLRYRLHAGQATATAFEAVAIASLVAQAAARARRAGQPDPVEGRRAIDRSTAQHLGITPGQIARQAIEAALGRSELLVACGATAAVARQPLESLQADPLIESDRAFARAAGRWLDGRVMAAAGRVPEAAIALVTAAVASPAFRWRLVRAASRRASVVRGVVRP